MKRSPDHHASRAADQVRAFNHATVVTDDGWQYPGHSYHAIGCLAHLARMLPQAIEQAALPVERTHKDGRILVDGGGDPAQAVQSLRQALAAAVTSANALAAALDQAHTASSPMGLNTRGLPGFEVREPCGESMCRCYGSGPEHADCACGCDCPRDADGQLVDEG
ncbi:MAG TPA: hypothetical protein VFH77_17490 [Streptomyces sp.]|nr:hypothetical protein [Streptomyces sp.]